MSYSLKDLSVGVALAAVAAGAIVYPSELWAVGLVSATVVLVAMAGLAVLLLRPRQAPFLCGFCALGSVFLLVFYGPDWLRGHVPQNLVTTYASRNWASRLEEAYKPQIPGAQVTRDYSNGQWINGAFWGNTPGIAQWRVSQNGKTRVMAANAPPNWGHLTDIANSLFMLGVAALGGLVGRYCHRVKRAQSSSHCGPDY